MPSLATRLLTAASLVLVIFLGLGALAIDGAYQRSARAALEDQLLTHIYLLLGAAELDAGGALFMPEVLTEPGFDSPASGLYAEIHGRAGTVVWRSRSSLTVQPTLEAPSAPGRAFYTEQSLEDGRRIMSVGFGVLWEGDSGADVALNFFVSRDLASLHAQRSGFRRTLALWLGSAGLLLLLVQVLVLRWGLAPLARLEIQIAAIEIGHAQRVEERQPRELQGLARNMNALLQHSRQQLERTRHALGDLAHSLKTPLAVLRGDLEQEALPDTTRQTLAAPLDSMQRSIDYQLQRAAAAGRPALGRSIRVLPHLQRLVAALRKVYAERELHWHIEVPDESCFAGDEGDLTEILGNLLDNAGKWARRDITIRGESHPGSGLRLVIIDDGPGIDAALREQVLKRGVRNDPATPGQGIGLAVVQELVTTLYQGRLELRDADSGGTEIVVHFPGPGDSLEPGA